MPLVSIVCATYNRSNILGYTLASARWQVVQDWELLVIGDACTDDTAAVVEAQQDRRIRFINLPRNHGEQSGPNNAGIAEAAGTYVAFLNHDDLWFPDHLSRLLEACEDPRVDVAHAASAAILPDGRPHLVADATGGTRRGTPCLRRRGWSGDRACHGSGPGAPHASCTTCHPRTAVDRAYDYEHPDHWRVPADSGEVPYRFPPA